MDIVQAVENIRQHLEAVAADAKNKLEQDLPGLASWAQSASQNPAVKSLSVSAHLPAVPEVLQTLATLIDTVDAALGNAKAQGAAEAQAAAQQPAS